MYPISLTFLPFKKTTQTENFNHEWRPAAFSSFIEEVIALLSNINEACLFRGHQKREWFIDSTFARRLKESQGIPLTERYSDEQINSVLHQHSLAKKWIDKVDKIILSPHLQSFVSQGVDPFYEYHKHLQQNQDNPLLKDIVPNGSNFIDFSEDWKVGLFFANAGRGDNDEGALFIVRQTVMGKVLHRGKTPFQDTFAFLKKHILENPNEMYGHLPLWIDPDFHLNNSLDQKPKRQKAVYVAQQDFRVDLSLSWELLHEKTGKQVFVKLILPKGTKSEVAEFLEKEGITQKYLFPKTIFDGFKN
jgi:hypothetical protein